MPLVKVWNKNIHPLEERFKGEMIRIPAGGCRVMDEEEAYQYKGQFKPIILDADGGHDARGFKILLIEPHDGTEPKVETKVDAMACMGCTYVGSSKADLEEHQNVMHGDQREAHKRITPESPKPKGQKSA